MIKLFLIDIDGCLTDGGYYVLGNSNEYIRKFNTKDFVGIEAIYNAGIKIVVLTGSIDQSKSQFDRAAPFINIYSNIQDKYDFIVTKFINDEIYSWDEICFIGDELNDAKLLENVGLAACPADASEEIQKIVLNKEGFVLKRNGGHCCVRELTDMIRAMMNIPARWCNWEEK